MKTTTVAARSSDSLQEFINRMRAYDKTLTLDIVKEWWRTMECCLSNYFSKATPLK